MNSFGRSLRAFGRKEIWSWPLFWFALPFYFTLSFFFDVFLTKSWKIEWLWIAIISLAAVLVLAIAIRFLIIDKFFRTRNSWLVNLIGVATLGAIKNVLVGELSILFGLVDSADWLFRVYGGAGLAIGLLFGFVYILGSRIDHNASMAQLEVARARLISHRAQAETLLHAERESLLQQTQRVLLPRLDQVQLALVNSAERITTIDALRDLVQNQVRPLSESLSKVAKTLTVAEAPKLPKKPKARMFHNSFLLKPLIRPGSMFLLFMAGNWFLTFVILGLEAAIWSLLYSLASLIVIIVVKALIPAAFKVKRGAGIGLLLLIGFAAANPTYWPLKEFSHNLEQDLLLLLVVLNVMFCVVGFAYSRSFEIDRLEAVTQMQRDNDSLAREVALFEQQMWIARRNWSFVVHGTVQAALTAAITRLSSGDQLEQYQIDMVMQDLNRAKEALSKTPEIDVDLPKALQNLASTWDGICQVKFQITDRATRALQRDSGARMCINEICKEAVSNAVRHGEAKDVLVEIDRDANELLVLKVSNNGRMLDSKIRRGIGSSMLDELTLNWSLTNNRATVRVDLDAELPISVITVGKF
jgi:two-component sensor histidine kinase